jgi:O-antigen/teichoic acid export membrane protein
MKNWLSTIANLVFGASFLSMVSTAVRLGGSMITLPAALKMIPQSEMGLYYTFMGITGVFMLFDFGFGNTISRNSAYAMAGANRFAAKGVPTFSGTKGPNIPLYKALVNASRIWYFSMGLIAAILLFTIGGWFIQERIKESGLSTHLIFAWHLTVLSSAWNFSTGFWINLLMGTGEVRKSAIIGLFAQLTALFLLIGGLLFGLGIFSYPIAALSSGILTLIFARKHFLLKVPISVATKFEFQTKEIFNDLWPMAWRLGIVLVGSYLSQRGNTVLSSARLGLNETASFGLTLQLLAIISQISAIPHLIALPKISQLRISSNISEIRKIFFTRVYGGLAIGLIGTIILSMIGSDMLHFIGSKTSLISPSLIILLGITLLLERHHTCYAELTLTENKNPFIWAYLITGFSNVVLAWHLSGILGIEGLILAQGITNLLCLNWWCVAVGKKGLYKSSEFSKENFSQIQTKFN